MILNPKGTVTVQIPQKELPVFLKAMEDVKEQNLGVFVFKLARMKLVELIEEAQRQREEGVRKWYWPFKKRDDITVQ